VETTVMLLSTVLLASSSLPPPSNAAPPIAIIAEELGYFPVTNRNGDTVYVPKRVRRTSSSQSIDLAKHLQNVSVLFIIHRTCTVSYIVYSTTHTSLIHFLCLFVWCTHDIHTNCM
jgi:hypothetical protein